MDDELLEILYEMVEQVGHVSKLLVSSEIALNDGELADSQKATMEAKNCLATMVGDVFEEFATECRTTIEETNDYDIPTVLELVRQLCDLEYNAGVMLGLTIDNQSESLYKTVQNKVQKCINTVVEIYNAIYNN